LTRTCWFMINFSRKSTNKGRQRGITRAEKREEKWKRFKKASVKERRERKKRLGLRKPGNFKSILRVR
jgi:hypothetical protein